MFLDPRGTCIPGGTLPANVTIAKNGKIIHDDYRNFQPRIGFAYSLTPKTVIHGGYGRFYDNWAGLTENQSNYTQLWPNVAFVGAPGGFNLFGPPTGLAKILSDLGTIHGLRLSLQRLRLRRLMQVPSLTPI